MAWVPGGDFLMGSNDFYPEERPVRRVAVDGFWIDDHPVTVAEFRRILAATGYVTVAERPLDPAQYLAPTRRCCSPARWSSSQPAGRPARGTCRGTRPAGRNEADPSDLTDRSDLSEQLDRKEWWYG